MTVRYKSIIVVYCRPLTNHELTSKFGTTSVHIIVVKQSVAILFACEAAHTSGSFR